MLSRFFEPSLVLNEQALLDALAPGFASSAQTPLDRLADATKAFRKRVREATPDSDQIEEADETSWLASNEEWLNPLVEANPRCGILNGIIGALRFAEVGIIASRAFKGEEVQITTGDLHDGDWSGLDDVPIVFPTVEAFVMLEAFAELGYLGWLFEIQKCLAASSLLVEALEKLKPDAD